MEVHRCRVVPYHPSSINALAFSHPSTTSAEPTSSDLRLALGRANGDIELWNPLDGAWVHESTLCGGKDRTIEALVWTQEQDAPNPTGYRHPGKLRLFSVGYSTHVTEWDLTRGQPSKHSDGNYGEVWCLAAQPRPSSSLAAADDPPESLPDAEPPTQDLAVGCADGSVVLFSTDAGDLKYKRLLAPKSAAKARVLSIAYRDRAVVVAGCANSTIRVLDTRSGQLLRIMSLGAGVVQGPRDILVWSVKCFPNGDIVSGDSTGELRFWDGESYSLLQRIKNHRADILDVAVSADGQTVFSGGMDRRTTAYKRTGAKQERERVVWTAVGHARLHQHDVKCLAVFDSTKLSVAVSGGLDTNLVITPLREYGKENHRTISSVPQHPPLQSAPSKRLMMCWWSREVWIWRFPRRSVGHGRDDDAAAAVYPPSVVAKILIKGEENISSASLSACGTLLAVSTFSELKVFRLQSRRLEDRKVLRVRRVDLPTSLARLAGRHVLFSPNSCWLCVVSPNSRVHMAKIIHAPGAAGVSIVQHGMSLSTSKRSRPRAASDEGLGAYTRTINRVAFSADSRILVAGSLDGRLDSWILTDAATSARSQRAVQMAEETASSSSDSDGSEAAGTNGALVRSQECWSPNPTRDLLPNLQSMPLLLAFRPQKGPPPAGASEDRLVVVTARHDLWEFNVLAGAFSPFGRRSLTVGSSTGLGEWKDRAMGSVWDVGLETERIWIYGSAWLCAFDLSSNATVEAAPPTTGQRVHEENGRKRKRSRSPEHTSGAGSRIPGWKRVAAIASTMRTFQGPKDDTPALLPLELRDDAGHDDDDAEGDVARRSAGARLRHAADAGQHGGAQDERSSGPGSHDTTDRRPRDRAAIWHTFRYRPILAIVPIADPVNADPEQAMANGSEAGGLERGRGGEHGRKLAVALVERPLWDVDLPPRYQGDHE
ncbi:MAG: U3 small nucleolar RNA-associated protein [Phylliscum demangeonii]|nr:MAG: U3 small nucleolar RNA-associated protein [Phylliscum demangeonii]